MWNLTPRRRWNLQASTILAGCSVTPTVPPPARAIQSIVPLYHARTCAGLEGEFTAPEDAVVGIKVLTAALRKLA